MTNQGNGQPISFRVEYSGKIKDSIKTLHLQAAQQGKGHQFLAALKMVLERLRHDPTAPAGLSDDNVRTVYRSATGLVFIGAEETSHNGLDAQQGQKSRGNPQGLPSKRCHFRLRSSDPHVGFNR